MEDSNRLLKELHEAKQHRKKLKLIERMIDGAKAHIEILDLYMEMNTMGNFSKIDKILLNTFYWDKAIKSYEKNAEISYHWLKSHGFDPYPMTPEQQKQFNKEFPDPYRWRVPAWLRNPIIRFFKSIFKPNNNESAKN